MIAFLLMLYIASEIIEERPADISKRAWSEMSRSGMGKVADYWHEKILPRHFTAQAKYTYHHALRSPAYLAWKLGGNPAIRQAKRLGRNLFHENIDNVLGGDMKETLLDRSLVRAYPTHVTLTMTGPRYMTMRPMTKTHGQQPDKAKEIGTVLRSEQEELAAVLDDSVQKDLDTYREHKVSKA